MVKTKNIDGRKTEEFRNIVRLRKLGSKHSEETKLRMSLAHKGVKKKAESIAKSIETRRKNGGYNFSEDHRKRLSLSLKGKKPWITGKNHSEETKKKLSIKNKGKHFSPSTEWKKGRVNTMSEDIKKKIGESNKGNVPWNKGKKCPQLSGKNSARWNGGKTKFLQNVRDTMRYKQWRSDVFKRDNWTCQTCGNKSGCGHTIRLEAHHIKRFITIIKDNKINTMEDAENCKELWDVSNGITLCKECHNLTKHESI